MNLEQTIQRLSDLSTLTREVVADEMSEVHLLPVKAEDAEALKNAAVVLECIRIAGGLFAKEAGQ